MARTDITRNATKSQDGQVSFEGGMNWIDAPNELQINESRLLVNVDIRRKDLEKAKGQRPFAPIEIGAEFYDRFFSTELDSSKFTGFSAGDSSVAINTDFELEITGVTTGHAWGAVGVVSSRESPTPELAYVEFKLTTPATVDSNTRFRAILGPANSSLSTDNGIQIEFDENNDVIKREDAAETDTTVNWAVSTTYNVRIENQATGFKAAFTNETTDDKVETSLFTTSFGGNIPSFLEFQVFGGIWKIDDVVYHPGFGAAIARKAANGIKRFYREVESNQTIVFAYGNMYRYTDQEGFIIISSGFDDTAKFSFTVFNDELICTNGVDRPILFNGSSVSQLGSGDTQAPIAAFIEIHLQSVFLLQNNSLFRNQPGNINIWDEFEPVVDVDAWNGDTGVGLIKLGSTLYIIKTSSVWEISGTLESNFILRRIPGTRGCVAPYSIATNGQIAFWRGIDGVYRFDGLNTTLISYRIHPAFNSNVKSPFETTAFTKAEDSVGVIHDYKYRLAVVQHGEPDTEFNNYEYILDFVANNNQGGWYARDRRNVNLYEVLDGAGDANELLFVPSDTSNILFEAEVEDGNTRGKYTSITVNRVADTPFVAQWQSRNLIAKGTTRDHLDKTWSTLSVHYTPYGEWHLGLTLTTINGLPGQEFTFAQSVRKNSGTFDRQLDNDFNLDNTKSLLVSNFMEEKFERAPKTRIESVKDATGAETASSFGDANRGVECFLELGQSQATRALSGVTGSGLRAQPGNYEPFRITRVLVGVQEEND